LTADSFPRLLSISYSTACPSLSERRPACSTAEMWTNTSFPPPPEGWMNPYPFVGLNHFTVPAAISVSNVAYADRRQSQPRQGRPAKTFGVSAVQWLVVNVSVRARHRIAIATFAIESDQRTTLTVKINRCLRHYITASLAAFTGRALTIF